MELPEGPIHKDFRKVLRGVGCHNGRRYNFHSCTYIFVLVVNILYLIYVVLFTDSDVIQIGHFILMGFFYLGNLWTMIYNSNKILKIANECDTLVGLDDEKAFQVNKFYAEEVKKYDASIAIRGILTVAVITTTNLCVEQILRAWLFQRPTKLPFLGTHPDMKVFIFLYFMQCFMIFISGTMVMVNVYILLGISVHLTTKYRVIGHYLAELKKNMVNNPNVYKSQAYDTIKRCVQSHNHIFRIFEEYREICTYGFRYTYIAIIVAIMIGRVALMGENGKKDFSLLPILIAELCYLGSFCYVLTELEEENEILRFGAYSCEWWSRMPKEIISSLCVIMQRTQKKPFVVLYEGTGPANNETFFKILNGTCAYIIFGLVLDKAM